MNNQLNSMSPDTAAVKKSYRDLIPLANTVTALGDRVADLKGNLSIYLNIIYVLSVHGAEQIEVPVCGFTKPAALKPVRISHSVLYLSRIKTQSHRFNCRRSSGSL